VTSTDAEPTEVTRTTPVRSWVDGAGSVPEVAPQPARVSSCPAAGAPVGSRSGATSVTGAESWASAMSVVADWRTEVTRRLSPGYRVTSTVFSVAVVAYGVGPLTRTRLTSWKQCPAVMIQVGDTSAAEQELS
jgi:hypothetical protein